MQEYLYATEREEVMNGFAVVAADLAMIYMLLSDFGFVPVLW